jgi:hypothetical protein
MKRKYNIFALTACFFALMILSCAKMNISVEILNAAYWAKPEFSDTVLLTNIISMHNKIADGSFFIGRDALKESITQSEDNPETRQIKLNRINDEYGKAKKSFIKAYNQLIISDKFEGKKRQKKLEDARSSYAEGSEYLANIKSVISDEINYAEMKKKSTEIMAANSKQEAGAKLREVERTKQKASNAEVARGTNEAVVKAEQVAEMKQKDAVRAEQEAVKANKELTKIEKVENQVNNLTNSGLIQGAGIGDDVRASTVVYAPSENWNGKFNQTVCSGWFGNTDCAVKMDGLGDFTIKGVRLDAAKITQATFSVATQTIQMAAAIYGFPVPKNQAPGDSPSPLEEVSPVKRQREAETAIMQLRLARLSMFETIVAQHQAIKENNRRAQAIETIKQNLDANSKLLTPTVP